MKENIAHAVGVEFTGSSDLEGGRHRVIGSDALNSWAIHLPHGKIATGVAPQDGGAAIASEVALTNDRPEERHIADHSGLLNCTSTECHLPHTNVATGITKENVARGVGVEVVSVGDRAGQLQDAPIRVNPADRAAQMGGG